MPPVACGFRQVRAVPANPNDSLLTAEMSWIEIDRMQSEAWHWYARMTLMDPWPQFWRTGQQEAIFWYTIHHVQHPMYHLDPSGYLT